MVTSRICYNSMEYELTRPKNNLPTLHEISRLRIQCSEEPSPDVSVLYVAMASWIPKCNMYHYNNPEDEETYASDSPIEKKQTDDSITDNVKEQIANTTENEIIIKPDTKILSEIVTPKKSFSPNRLNKKILSEEKKKERERIKEEKLKMLEEKKKVKQGEQEKRILEKQKKFEEKQKELEEKQKIKEIKEEKKKKEREEKEMKRKEKEEKEEQKRKELMEKSIEKQKLAEKKEKTVAAFVNFFTKKPELQVEEKMKETSIQSTFMPFELKSDMRLAPIVRAALNDSEKVHMLEALEQQTGRTYLEELKSGKKIGRSEKTWPITEANDDVMIVEDVNPGESIEEQSKIVNKTKAKFLKFDGNRRPPYFGTWRKKSVSIKPRNPFAIDNAFFDYDVDSDEDWEEDDSGESLRGSDDDKENDSENEYEEDNEFFVPHGHLSDDEVDDVDNVTPEAHKAKLKLLKREFDEQMRSKTAKIKPRVIGCIWYNKDGNNVDEAIDSFLKPLSIISNGPITIKKRSKFSAPFILRRSFNRGKELESELVPGFLKFVHGSMRSSKALIIDFLSSLEKQNINAEVTRTSLSKDLRKFASWTREPDGDLKKRWLVHKNVKEEYNVDLPCFKN
ncbi:hypothetical protein FQR65_LT05570 [Abscondita terminalis]|nr:hypothetical protein FQR65_LT05570 [Abscondita terminalis]